ncbi:MAG TPA: 2-iminoacetate synthase ThiH, partial [Opitutaceae bacterium]|nr:2-iminoacetate synthase ThiH [Opitutaceae bacterium]HQL22706.1 2-iminoacetate synthase ThiH [Opitutaceae bacterium]
MNFTEVWQAHDFEQTRQALHARTAADVRRALGRVDSGLGLDDLQALLSPAAVPFLEEMAQLSHRRTVERFGRTMQLFAPLYLTNVCSNVCAYCGFNAHNRIPRRILGDEEIRAE